jgi:hypothetical protein
LALFGGGTFTIFGFGANVTGCCARLAASYGSGFVAAMFSS